MNIVVIAAAVLISLGVCTFAVILLIRKKHGVSVTHSDDGYFFDSSKGFLPDSFTEILIYGGNHAQFGSYGEQSGDGKAEISPEEQWDRTVDAIYRLAHLKQR